MNNTVRMPLTLRSRIPIAVMVSLLLGTLAPGAAARAEQQEATNGSYQRPGITERVSVASDGAQANAGVRWANSATSGDGRYVAFSSTAPNLVPGDTNGAEDVFVHDRATGATERVSVASDGAQAVVENQPSSSAGMFGSSLPAMSADGRYVGFTSTASNLVPGDTSWVCLKGENCISDLDVFVHDRATGTTEWVSVSSAQANANFSPPVFSADGRYVAFTSGAPNLVPGDTNGAADVFVHDRATGATERVSVASDGAESILGGSSDPAISADGRYVAFTSMAHNFVPDDTNNGQDVFVHDRATGATERVSVASDGAGSISSPSANPAISADGRYVAFDSMAHNFVPDDTNNGQDVFVHDRATGATERVSVASDGTQALFTNGGAALTPESGAAAISADGRLVAFYSFARNLVPDDTNTAADVFVHDRATGATERVSVASDRAEANASSGRPVISNDGSLVTFESGASNLVPGDTNGPTPLEPNRRGVDVFVRDRGGSLGVLGTPSVLATAGSVSVSGRVTFSGTTLAVSPDPGDDGAGAGAVGELTGVALIYRPELDDLLLRLDLGSLPAPGVPAILYGMEFSSGGTTYQVRALGAAATAVPPRASSFALYRCDDLVCTEHALLTGSLGTTGEQVLVSVPLSALGATVGTHLTSLRAFTAAGEAALGSPIPLDEVSLSSSEIPVTRVELGIDTASTPPDEVAFTVEADLLAGDFSGTMPTDGLSPGSYRLWSRACLGTACGPASATPVTLE